MKLTLTVYDETHIMETKGDDLMITDYIRLFKGLLVGAGFSEELINEYIKEC